MRGAGVLGLCGLLTACVSPPNQPPGISVEYVMDVKSVTLPASTAATASLDIDVEVTVGGCRAFRRFEATRSATRLTLTAIGTRTLNVPCTANIGWEHRTYTDPGTPDRVEPFEVVVNGTGWGNVTVVAPAPGGTP